MYNEAGWLSEDAHDLQVRLAGSRAASLDCDVLIVGSGYGGAVAAARLAGMAREGTNLDVIVVERGREYLPGMFPSRFGELAGHVRFSAQNGARARGNDTALYDIRTGADVNVVLASGLGGGSLINAAVMERPEPSAWASGWPAGIDADSLEGDYLEVLSLLQAAPLPADRTFAKLGALQQLGDALPGEPLVQRCHIAVAFSEQETPDAGVLQQPCTACGDCATGCNQQAKNSLDANYLALAKRRGAKLYCGVLAHHIERGAGGAWTLKWTPMAHKLPWADETAPIRARWLIVCAGSLGSTELLQRSQSDSLRFSQALGSRFSANGDMIAAAADLPVRAFACGDETTRAGPLAPGERGRNVGPTITGMLRSGEGVGRFTVQEFSIPAPLRPVLGEAVGSFGMLQKMMRFDFSLHRPGQRRDDPLAPSDDAIDRSIVYGLMGDDGAKGRMEPVGTEDPAQPAWDGRIAIHWPEARRGALFDCKHEALAKAYAQPLWSRHVGNLAHRGTFIPNPLWRPLPEGINRRLLGGQGARGPITTVHPLGGCPMGDTVAKGVVDAAGCVFDAADSVNLRKLHDGLVVLDGAIVPRALGINPALTIAALAEHAMPVLQARWQLTPRTDLGGLAPVKARPVWRTPQPRPPDETTGIRLREKVTGTLRLQDRPYWAELEVCFAPISDVRAFVATLPRDLPFEGATLRLYADRGGREDEPQWLAQAHVEEEPLWTVPLSGGSQILFRRWSTWPGRMWRGLRANFRQSGGGAALPGIFVRLRETWQQNGGGWSWQGIKRGRRGVLTSIKWMLAIATHLGERRGLDYHLRVDGPVAPACPLQVGDQLVGRKRLDCSRGANPWRQISEMAVSWRPARAGAPWKESGALALDLTDLVRQRGPLLHITQQSDHATALADVGGLALLCLRVTLKSQLMSFVPPAAPAVPRHPAGRLPGELPGLTMVRHDLRPDLKALLTRYQSRDLPPRPGSRPVLLIHGYTASGSTYAHGSMDLNLVQSLCREGRDVWVVELRTSIAFDKRDSEDCGFDDIAQDITPIIAAVLERVDGAAIPPITRVDVLAHCIGAAMFCREALRNEDLHQSIGAVVLSQVGPLLRMSPANLLRGYVASYLAQYLGSATLDASPGAFGPGGGLGVNLVDVLLASMPYPQRDRGREWARTAVGNQRPDFRLVRHRIDAMLGSVMELSDDSPLADRSLDELDDLFGYARTKTLAQVIHYGRHSMLADSDGRNRVICGEALARRMAFPILLLHGRRSGVFDWRGSLQSFEWLRAAYAMPAELLASQTQRTSEKLHLGLNTPRQLCVFDKLGHQDTVIGRRAPHLVFPVINEFLRNSSRMAEQAAASGIPPTTAAWAARLPWVGPVVGWLRRSDPSTLKVSLVLHPSPVHTSTRFVVIVPMLRAGGNWVPQPETQYRYWNDLSAPPVPVFRQTDTPLPDIGPTLRAGAVTLNIDQSQVNEQNAALLFLTVHNDLTMEMSGRVPQYDLIARPMFLWCPYKERALHAVRRFFSHPHPDLEPALLRLSDQVILAADHTPGPSSADRTASLRLAVASCQYPNGLLDAVPAGASLRRLAYRLDAGEQAPQLLLLLGDQVYVDETAGVFDPAPVGGALDQTYDRAFRRPEFRAVTSRLPTYMLLDDHEVEDNWQPPLRPSQGMAHGRYVQTQAVLNPPPIPWLPGPPLRPTLPRFSFKSLPGGWPLFVMDTRSWRQQRSPANFDEATIVRESMEALEIWLQQAHAASEHGPKFIAMASAMLPFERGEGRRWGSDTWAGYPASRTHLLRFIWEKKIRNVVLLAGDLHLSIFSKLVISPTGTDPVAVYSVVSSGLYAPWLFSNAESCNYDLAGAYGIDGNAGPTLAVMSSVYEARNGFVEVEVSGEPNALVLEIVFDTAVGRRSFTQPLGLTAEPLPAEPPAT